MHIPKRLEQKLKADRAVRSTVDAAIAEFVPWLEDSKLPFFPDYTDHGTKHVEGILVTASSLVGDEAWAALTAQDVGVLILATLLHDCAMHLTEDGFQALVEGRTHTTRIQGFGDADWPALWQEYLFSAKRFDDRALTDLFGEPLAVRTPPANVNEMTRADRLLIGEFVRRHHPRLAHEIALYGVPGPTDRPIKLSESLDPDLADLAGLVARSHGLSLRATLGYLHKDYDQRDYNGVHAVFLMAVLRIADYLQIQAERAPRQTLKVKEIRSPFSRREWAAHHAVKNIVTSHEDPEAIFIKAKPTDVHTFLRLKSWLGGIQEELDTSWAVLGEVYGRFEDLRRLGLVIRRVRSNLDDARAFAGEVPYVPRRVEFDIARSEILKLLVRPLYGDRPEVGIRELLQNSVDAVRELWDLQEHNPKYKNADLLEQEADVVMRIDVLDDTGRATFTISDRGIGMTEEVIADYFLKVGASYRHSDAWARQHERTDEESDAEQDSAATPRSRVLRSGRFGIGALAAFLLGDEIEVSTRHVTAPTGIRFTTRLDSEAVELRYVEGLRIGTTVRVPLPRDYLEVLTGGGGPRRASRRMMKAEQWRWDWYGLSVPSVVRLEGPTRSGQTRTLTQTLQLPGLGGGLPPGWFGVEVAGYRAVHCNLSTDPGLVCNGIEIRNADEGDYSVVNDVPGPDYAPPAIMVNHPLVSVFDPDSNLPLDLTRSRLTEGDFGNAISEATLRYFLAYLLVYAPTEYESPAGRELMLVSQRRESSYEITAGRWPFCPLFYTAAGSSLAEPWNIMNTDIKRALVTAPGKLFLTSSLPVRHKYDATFLVEPTTAIAFTSSMENQYLVDALAGGFDRYYRAGKVMTGARILISDAVGQRVLNEMRVLHRQNTPPVVEWSNGQWMLLTNGNPPPTLMDVNSLPETTGDRFYGYGSSYAAEWFLQGRPPGDLKSKPSKLAALWEEIIREPAIPYDPRERRGRLAHAYEVLAPYIEKIESDKRAEAVVAKKPQPPPPVQRGKSGRRRAE